MQIIDGQQRITTLVLIAAVSQHVLRQLAGKMTDEHAEQRQLVNQASWWQWLAASPAPQLAAM